MLLEYNVFQYNDNDDTDNEWYVNHFNGDGFNVDAVQGNTNENNEDLMLHGVGKQVVSHK